MRADRLLLDVDPPVSQVGQRAHRPRQVLDVPDGEAVLADHRDQHALGQRATRVVAGPQRVGRLPLDDVEVVAALPHGLAQRGVRRPGLLRSGGGLGLLGPQLGRHRDQVLEHVGRDAGADLQRGQAKPPVGRVLLRVGQRDLQLRPAARRLPAQEFGHGHRQRRGQLLDQRQLRLPAAVLDEREDRWGPVDPLTELGQGQTAHPAQVPQPLAEGNKVYTIGLDQIFRIFHSEAQYNFLNCKKQPNFTHACPMQPPS